MGSCISKCKPNKKKFKEDSNSSHHVHDKLVISQDPPTISPVAPDITIMPSDTKPLSPAPSTSSTASFSSFSCSTNSKCAVASSISSSSSLSSSSSSYSSTLLMKDRSFSNDFLWSCVKENPQIVGLKEKTAEKTVSFPSKIHHSHNLDPSSMLVSSPFVKKSKQIVQEKAMMMMNTTPKKRARASSPTLVRQKSFRKEQNYCVGSTPNRGLRSPSPSRRFNGGESNRIFPVKESCYRNQVVSSSRGITPAPKRESFRVPNPSPKRESSIDRDCLVRRNDAMSQHISGKSDGKEIDVVMEDIDNPLIALDCFIFL